MANRDDFLLAEIDKLEEDYWEYVNEKNAE